MATYAIGDIQGCYKTFLALLDKIGFRPDLDQLWLVGDVINRGQGSLEMLRWCYDHQSKVKLVLGNHDLHALGVAHGIRKPHRSDTLESLLISPDADTLLNWLRQQPLLYGEGDYLMVHAGIWPKWTVHQATQYALEVQEALSGPHFVSFLEHMYGNHPAIWDEQLSGFDRLRCITNIMTRMRICNAEGALDFTFKAELSDIPEGYYPWFNHPEKQEWGCNIICGHWSALGLYQHGGIFALDTGCLWGRMLTAMCLETREIYQVPLESEDRPPR